MCFGGTPLHSRQFRQTANLENVPIAGEEIVDSAKTETSKRVSVGTPWRVPLDREGRSFRPVAAAMERRASYVLLVVALFILSCSFMTVAWYGHLKFASWPTHKAILLSWAVALAEYAFMVPANRIGHARCGMSAADLRALAEVCILGAFMAFSVLVLREPLRVNHAIGFAVVLIGVCVVFKGPFEHVLVDLGDVGDVRREKAVDPTAPGAGAASAV